MPLILDGDITTGFLRKRKILAQILGVKYVPEPIYNYAKRISEITGLPIEEVLESRPVKNMIRKWTKLVPVSSS